MSPKTGRPLKKDPKDTRIQVRLDKDTLNKLDICVDESKSNRSEILRQGINLVYANIKKEK